MTLKNLQFHLHSTTFLWLWSRLHCSLSHQSSSLWWQSLVTLSTYRYILYWHWQVYNETHFYRYSHLRCSLAHQSSSLWWQSLVCLRCSCICPDRPVSALSLLVSCSPRLPSFSVSPPTIRRVHTSHDLEHFRPGTFISNILFLEHWFRSRQYICVLRTLLIKYNFFTPWPQLHWSQTPLPNSHHPHCSITLIIP